MIGIDYVEARDQIEPMRILQQLKLACYSAIFMTSQTAYAQDMSSLANEVLEISGAPAASIGVMREGNMRVASAGTIYRNGPAVTDESLWHIGSNTKSMTATLIARLAERGVIRWEDTIADVLGPVLSDIDQGYRAVTYADLLHHRAGLRANPGRLSMIRMSGSVAERDVLADRLSAADAALAQAPQAQGSFQYSNLGYIVAGAMLEQQTGLSWETLITRHVFSPLGMDSAGFGAPGVSAPETQPWGHRKFLFVRRAISPGPAGDNPPFFGPAGTVHLSIPDHLTYLNAHATQDTTFLTPESWRRLHDPPEGADYSAGWGHRQGVLAHAGSNTMWYSFVAFDPQTRTSAVINVNSGDRARAEAAIAAVVAKLFQQ